MSVVPPPLAPLSMAAGPSSHGRNVKPSKLFDVVAAYKRALGDHTAPHPIAAILALVELMEASTATTSFGLAEDVKNGRETLMNTQPSLGVRAGCQLWERFFSLSGGGDLEFPMYKRSLISQGRSFCTGTAPQCREKIAALATDFLSDDVTILTHSYSRTVVQTILRAHAQNKRIQVYVTEARPSCLGVKTHQILTAQGIPCTVVLDSAVGYIMERVDLVLVGSEAVVESGALVSSVGTYQVALVAKALQKPFYALAESYKFLRHYPLSQTDLPMPRHPDSTIPEPPLTFPSVAKPQTGGDVKVDSRGRPELGEDLERRNPTVDVTAPNLIDFIITDLGAPLSPTSVSQYLVAQFSS